MFLLKNHAENEARRLDQHLVLFFSKTSYEAKEMACSLVSIYFDSLQLGI